MITVTINNLLTSCLHCRMLYKSPLRISRQMCMKLIEYKYETPKHNEVKTLIFSNIFDSCASNIATDSVPRNTDTRNSVLR